MSKLVIADLAESKTLDSTAMTSICGGMRAFESRSLYWGPMGDRFTQVNPTQAISQFQGLENAVGNNVANFGVANVHNTNTQNQHAQNNVNVGGFIV
ncbi:conserved hypothetical protein [Nitrosococcus halophilus Nc 4]|uniref:Uncharacterized protein n=1 Tax=Nitrosococcus halophilus (strain Nc4) TaxID=472759 RepID=D5C3X5_NITHN|nr:hypothetical protein [Nitrosococcus halophilus]ADE15097.1 conserved hypothetical protein [Nitrosococcus halophilus Nc 4]